MTITFPRLEQHQQDVYDAVKDSFGSGKMFICKSRRQTGKSTLANIILLTYATQHPGSKSFMLEPTNTQCRNQYLEIKKWLGDAPFVDNFNNTMNEIYLKNGSVIIFKSAELRDRLRGFTCSGILIIDECAFIPNDVIDNTLPWVDVKSAPVLCISTPMFCDGYFYEWFSNPDNNTSFSFDWAAPKYKESISKFLSDEKLEFYRKQVSEMKFKSEYLGQFIEDGGYVFRNIQACIRKDDSKCGKPIYAGIDFGSGTGNDYTVLTLFDKDKNLTEIHYWNDVEPVEQTDLIANIINNNNSLISVKVEQQSIGEVYISLLKKKVKRPSIIKKFNTTNDTKKTAVEEFAKALVNEEVTLPDNDFLYQQMIHFTVRKLKSGNYTYENDSPNTHDDAVMSMIIGFSNFDKKQYSLKISK